MEESIMKGLVEFLNESKRLLELNTPKDYTGCSDEKIIEIFRYYKNLFHKEGKNTKDEFYGGITNDIPSNLRRHNIQRYIICVEVESFDTAKRIEGLLCSELGFFIGEYKEGSAGRGGTDDSTIVYMAQRDAFGFKD